MGVASPCHTGGTYGILQFSDLENHPRGFCGRVSGWGTLRWKRAQAQELGGENFLNGVIVRSGRQAIEELKPKGQSHSRDGLRETREEPVEVAQSVT